MTAFQLPGSRRRGACAPTATRRHHAWPERLEPRRLLAAGALDPTFGDGGEAFIPVPVSPVNIGDVLIQPDGKILIGSISGGEDGNHDALLARLNPDGTLDAPFGDGGVVVIDLGNNEQVTGLALQSDGQIIVAGAFGDVMRRPRSRQGRVIGSGVGFWRRHDRAVSRRYRLRMTTPNSC